jgi:hypothetical protein
MTPKELHEKTIACVFKWEATLEKSDWENQLNTMREEFKALDQALAAINKVLEAQSELADSNETSAYDSYTTNNKRKRAYDPDETETNSKHKRLKIEDTLNNHLDAKMSFDHSAKEKIKATEDLLNDYRELLTPPLKLHRYT